MTYAYFAWELAADTYLLKLQLLQIRALRAIGKFPRCTRLSAFHTYTWRQQAEVMQNHENEHIRIIGQGEARHGKGKRLKLGL
jgi:hypothetical protein